MKSHFETIRHTGTVGEAGRVRFGFDEGSIAHIMTVLIDLYSNRRLAAIREPALNALDSHKAAGNAQPIEVCLPTRLYPVYSVRDYGVGLSVDDLTNHYSKYGWSSKRDTDDEVGMLGLGCKAPLTYCDQFTVTAVYEGVKAIVLITRDHDGAGALQVVDTCATDERNGVLVEIPVDDHEVGQFINEAENFFGFWDEGTVLIDGEPIQTPRWGFQPIDLQLDPDVSLTDSHGEDHIVMGNVAYPCDDALSGNLTRSYSVNAIVRVPIGTIDFAPSREAVQHTARTAEAIATARAFITERLTLTAQADIDAAPSHLEGMKRAQKWIQALPQGAKVTYRGDVIPQNFYGDMVKWHDNGSYSGRYSQASKKSSTPANTAHLALHVTGFTGRLSATMKEVTHNYLREIGHDSRDIIYSREPIGRPWLNGVAEVTWAELKARAPRSPKTMRGPRPKASYKVLDRNGAVAFTTELKGHWIWMGTWENTIDRKAVMNLLGRYGRGTCVVLVDQRSLARFARKHPNVRHIGDYAVTRACRAHAAITGHDAWSMNDGYTWDNSPLSELDATLVDDPAIVSLINDLGQGQQSPQIARWRTAINLACEVNRFDDCPKLPKAAKGVAARIHAASAPYPLLEHLDYSGKRQANAVVEYVNAIYRQKTKLRGTTTDD